MRQAVLLGNPGTKRTLYLEKGAEKVQVPMTFWDWKQFNDQHHVPGEYCGGPWSGKEIFLKIDPPVWDSCSLEELDSLTQEYEAQLKALESLGERGRVWFLNRPQAIWQLLDKRECKSKLKTLGIPVTEALEEPMDGGESLLKAMEAHRVPQVFIKPVRGSGAAGIAAFRWQRKTGNMMLYTCGMEDPETGCLVNTKRLRCFTDRGQVMSFLDRLFQSDCIVERWYAKAQYQGFSYDLRAVIQDGQMDFMLARLSKGPITNLHLNNHPLNASELNLPLSVLEETADLCRRAAEGYEGLRSVGIDILLENGSLRPRIIEMNGQGDLIYQDIYHENRIYRHQAEMMKRWLCGNV